VHGFLLEACLARACRHSSPPSTDSSSPVIPFIRRGAHAPPLVHRQVYDVQQSTEGVCTAITASPLSHQLSARMITRLFYSPVSRSLASLWSLVDPYVHVHNKDAISPHVRTLRIPDPDRMAPFPNTLSTFAPRGRLLLLIILLSPSSVTLQRQTQHVWPGSRSGRGISV
jgi:hypothetical protein